MRLKWIRSQFWLGKLRLEIASRLEMATTWWSRRSSASKSLLKSESTLQWPRMQRSLLMMCSLLATTSMNPNLWPTLSSAYEFVYLCLPYRWMFRTSNQCDKRWPRSSTTHWIPQRRICPSALTPSCKWPRSSCLRTLWHFKLLCSILDLVLIYLLSSINLFASTY